MKPTETGSVVTGVLTAGRIDQGPCDIVIENGHISDVHIHTGLVRPTHGRRIIDGSGLIALPGAVDMHVHFREPGAEHKETIASGSEAAVRAGITTVADMPNNDPPCTTVDAFLEKADICDRDGRCDVMLFMGLTASNSGQIATVRHHPRFAGVKVFLGATTGSLLCSLDALQKAAGELDCLFAFHAEWDETLRRASADRGVGDSAGDHLSLRPVQAATDAVGAILSVHRPGMRFHICHVSTAAELDLIRNHPWPGVSCEAAPHHMAFSAGDTVRLGNLGKMNPPLRVESDRAAILAALLDGRIDCVATDHAPHTTREKNVHYSSAPSGVPGVDTMVAWILELVKAGLADVDAAALVMSTNPAKILGLSDRGAIEPGLRADVMLWDPAAVWTVRNEDIRSKCGWSPFAGMELAARPVMTCCAGKWFES